MYLPSRAHRCTPTLSDIAYVVRHVRVVHNAHVAFIRRTTADLSTFIRGLHTHELPGPNTRKSFFLSSTSFLDIKAFNIERRIAMRDASFGTADRFYRVGNFGVNSPRTTVSTNREDVRRDCRLLLVERY